MFKKILDFFKNILKEDYRIYVTMTIEITVDLDTFASLANQTLRTEIDKLLLKAGYTIDDTLINDLGEITTNPETGERIRKNGKFSKIHAVKYTYVIDREIGVTKKQVKENDYDLLQYPEEMKTVLDEAHDDSADIFYVKIADFSSELRKYGKDGKSTVWIA
jgi:hypothetical protein